MWVEQGIVQLNKHFFPLKSKIRITTPRVSWLFLLQLQIFCATFNDCLEQENIYTQIFKTSNLLINVNRHNNILYREYITFTQHVTTFKTTKHVENIVKTVMRGAKCGVWELFLVDLVVLFGAQLDANH